MINIVDTVLSIVNSLFSITMIILPLLMMKNYNLIIISNEGSKDIVIKIKGMTVYLSNQNSINENLII